MLGQKISAVGLGYAGLPVAVAFGMQARVSGFDINEERLGQLRKGYDRTKEIVAACKADANILVSCDTDVLAPENFHAGALSTPDHIARQPECSAPGVIFIDRRHVEPISATTPREEIPLPPSSACAMGSINLSQFVDGSFGSDQRWALLIGC